MWWWNRSVLVGSLQPSPGAIQGLQSQLVSAPEGVDSWTWAEPPLGDLPGAPWCTLPASPETLGLADSWIGCKNQREPSQN